MEFEYNNCLVTINEDDFSTVIKFGDTTISDNISAESMEEAKLIAVSQIDLFIGDLPPALFYRVES